MTDAPFHDRDGYIWMDGALKPWRETQVHVLTHGLHYASSVFEGERAYGGVIFKSREHSERLHNSARLLDFELPYDVDQIEAAKQAVLKANGMTDAYVRAFAWRGSEEMGVKALNNTVHVAIAAWKWGAYFGQKEGIRLAMADWRRPSPETAPSHAKAAGLYMICTLAKHAAEAKGFNDALMLDYRGRVAECTGANLFFVKGGEIHTPTPDCFLNGITRQTAVALAGRRQVKVHERVILPEELGEFEQCFVTGTAAEITPVAQIAEHSYAPGGLVDAIANDYSELVHGRLSL